MSFEYLTAHTPYRPCFREKSLYVHENKESQLQKAAKSPYRIENIGDIEIDNATENLREQLALAELTKAGREDAAGLPRWSRTIILVRYNNF